MRHISKLLSLALRHNPNALALHLDEHGYAKVSHVLKGLKTKGHDFSREDLERLVLDNDKQRFAFNDGGDKIRASQGHSIQIDLGYQPKQPPDVLYHGTATRYLDSIHKRGILKGSRAYVHLSDNTTTALNVGGRHGNPIVLSINASLMYEKQHEFYLSDNGIWLTDFVPSRFIL